MKTSIYSICTFVLSLFIISCQQTGDPVLVEKVSDSPNIVFIISDDQAWTDYSFMGHKHIETPHIDRLAEEGLTFTQAYVPTSLCAPSLATIITGLYPRRHQVLGNDRRLPNDQSTNKSEWRAKNYEPVIDSFRSLTTLPDLLKDKGYLSFQTGKWWLGNYANGGFDYGMTHGDPSKGGRHGDEGLKIGRTGMDTLFNYIDMAVEEEKPFFMWYAPFLPHAPHTPPDSLLQKYLPKAPSEYVAKYWAMCEWFDITCGQLMDYIDEKGQTENTLFVYVCDNGWVQNESDSKYNKISKRSPYDYGMRTPIMFKWSGKIDPRREASYLASSIDIVPTILSLLDIPQPKELQGINVLDTTKLQNRKAIFGEIYAHDFNTIKESIFYKMAVTKPYKLILPSDENKPGEKIQLYDVFRDPYEEVNLADVKPEMVESLKKMIEDSWEEN